MWNLLLKRAVPLWGLAASSRGDLLLHIHLPNQQNIYVAAAIMRWVRGQKSGLESLLIEKQTHDRLKHYVRRLVQEPAKIVG